MAKDLEAKVTFKAIDEVSKTTRKIERNAERMSNNIAKSVKNAMVVVGKATKTAIKGVAVGIGAVTAASVGLLKAFSEIEDAAAAFEPLMGGAKGAADLVDALNETAATTPFQFSQLSEVAKLFLPSVNGNIEQTIKYTRMLGDATGGNAEKFKSASVAMAKLMMTEKATQEHLGSFVIAGIPVYKELGDMLGVSTQKIVKMTRQGNITSATMTKLFEKMTSKGGIFYRGMDIASGTLTGKISTLKDNLKLLAAGIGKVLNPVAKKLTDYLIGLVQQGREWIKANEGLIRSKFMSFVNKVPMYFRSIVNAGKLVIKIIKGIAHTIDTLNISPIEKLSALIKGLSKDSEETSVQVSNLGSVINVQFADALRSITKFTDAIGITNSDVEKTGGLISSLTRVFSAVFSEYLPIVTGFFTVVLDFITSIINNVRNVFSGLLSGIIDLMEGNFLIGIERIGAAIFNALTAPIRTAISLVLDLVKKLGLDMFAFDLGIDLDSLQGIINKGIDVEASGAVKIPYVGTNPKETIDAQKEQRLSEQQSPYIGESALRRTETTRTEKYELTIKDETGRAEITKEPARPKGKRPAIVHTGGM